ncbi:MAG TPA: VKOR family protein, partial [Algoriphagus sp.]|nr:VKOR family protein [Algoriphagus sp.]
EYLDERGKLIKQARKEFVTLWTGITLVVEKGEHSGEPRYSQRRKEQMIYQFLHYFLGAVGLACILGWDNSTSYSLEAIALFIIKLTGLGISAILLWSEVDKKNTAITQFCG